MEFIIPAALAMGCAVAFIERKMTKPCTPTTESVDNA